MNVNVTQCKHCKKYDDLLNHEGICIDCEDSLRLVDEEYSNFVEYERIMQKESLTQEEDGYFDPYLYDGMHLLIEDEDPSC